MTTSTSEDKQDILSQSNPVPLVAIPQGPGSRLDSDTVDGVQVSSHTNPAPGTLVPTGTDGKLPVSIIPSAPVAKAWVVFDASTGTPVIADSFNVTSITDNGVGDFTINFTTAFANTNYCVIASASNNVGRTVGCISTKTVNGVRIIYDALDNTSGAQADPTEGNVIVFSN